MGLLLKNASILAAGEGTRFRCLENAFLAVEGDTITYIGTERPAGDWEREKDMTGKLLLPGLVNAHCHAPMTLLRGLGSDLPLQEWLFDHMFPIEARLTAQDMRIGNALALLEMLSTGTTSYSDMYFHPEVAAENALAAGIKANLCRACQCFNGAETPEENISIRENTAVFDQWHGAGNGRVRIDFGIHAEYTNYPHIVEAYAALCAQRGARMHIHLSETEKEHVECVAKYGKTPARRFADLGVFDVPTAAAHCVAVTEEDMALLAEKGVSVVHNPSSNMKLGSGFAPIPRMLELGVNVALGTDGAASNNNLNLMEEMHLAAIIHNGRACDPTLMRPEQVLAMATANGARLQGRTDTGSLEVGKKADIIALDLDRPHLVPNLDTAALLVYAAQGSDVVMTMVDGQIVYENSEFLTLDKERILHAARSCAKKLYA